MNVHVGEMNSTVRTTESEALLTPELLRQITAAVSAAIREQNAYEARRLSEQRIVGGVTQRKASWE